MSTIVITVVNQTGADALDIELPDSMLVQDFLPKILMAMAMKEKYSSQSCALIHVTTERILSPRDTLASVYVGSGDTLRLVFAPNASKST